MRSAVFFAFSLMVLIGAAGMVWCAVADKVKWHREAESMRVELARKTQETAALRAENRTLNTFTSARPVR